jgi:hypothetical protein
LPWSACGHEGDPVTNFDDTVAILTGDLRIPSRFPTT